MPRLPILTPEDMDAEQRSVHDEVMATTGRVGGGPSIGYAYAPGMWRATNELSAYLDHTSLTAAQVRIAGLVTVRHWNSAFPWAAQARAALAAGVAPEAVEAINAGGQPDFDDAGDAAVYRAASEIIATGTLGDAGFKAAVDALDYRRLVDVVAVVGHFCKTAMMANAAGAEPPKDAPSQLKPR